MPQFCSENQHAFFQKVCFCEFDEEGPALSLKCGHEFCAVCWEEELKSKIKAGPSCLFTKCQQLNCNMIVPYSFFLKLFKDETNIDGTNYHAKYL